MGTMRWPSLWSTTKCLQLWRHTNINGTTSQYRVSWYGSTPLSITISSTDLCMSLNPRKTMPFQNNLCHGKNNWLHNNRQEHSLFPQTHILMITIWGFLKFKPI